MSITMLFLIVGFAVAFVLLTAAMNVLRGPDDEPGNDADFAVATTPYFFTVAENRFYGELAAAAGEMGLLVFPKVGLNDVFKNKDGAPKGQYNRYAQMHVDFLLVSKHEYRPVAGIELDGSSHSGEKQQARDQKKNQVFRAAGLPLLRFVNHTTITPDQLRQKLEDGIGLLASAAR